MVKEGCSEKFADIEEMADGLRKMVREHNPGSCKIFSKGGGCKCGLCAIDSLVRMAYAARHKGIC